MRSTPKVVDAIVLIAVLGLIRRPLNQRKHVTPNARASTLPESETNQHAWLNANPQEVVGGHDRRHACHAENDRQGEVAIHPPAVLGPGGLVDAQVCGEQVERAVPPDLGEGRAGGEEGGGEGVDPHEKGEQAQMGGPVHRAYQPVEEGDHEVHREERCGEAPVDAAEGGEEAGHDCLDSHPLGADEREEGPYQVFQK